MARTLFSFPTPFTPPTTEEDRLSWLRLIRSRRVGVSTFFRLLGEHGSAAAALDALPALARSAGIDGYRPADVDSARAEMDAAHIAGARMLCFGESDYPADLAGISDPPPLVWCVGDIGLLSRSMVAMVGARNASSLGVRMARRLAAGLGGTGICIVSGLARGIDAAAHAAAIDTGTIAVMAGGVDVIYPVENMALAHSIAERGLLVSEAPMGLAPIARHFPSRNRIVSGLARAVIVVEAAARSGSLITARDALDQGREVMAVPGHPFDSRAAGCNLLIHDGATLVRGADDVLAALPPVETAADMTQTHSADPVQPVATASSAGDPSATRRTRGAGDGSAGAAAIPSPNPAPVRHRTRTIGAVGHDSSRAPDGGGQDAGQHQDEETSAGASRTCATASTTPHPRPSGDSATRHPDPRRNGSMPSPSAARSPSRALAAGHRPSAKDGRPLHAEILGRLGPSPLAEDQLIRDLGLPAARVAIELLTLEMEGRVQRQPGGLVCLAGASLTSPS